MADYVWSERDTTPSAVGGALRGLLEERFRESPEFVPARVLNLVLVVDREWRGEVENRLERVGLYHPSRTILCAVEPGRSELDAWATVASETPGPGAFALGRERIVLQCGPEHLSHLDTIVDPLLVSDLMTAIWAPHGHEEAVDALLGLVQVVLLDSVEGASLEHALDRSRRLAERAYVVDLAWLRSTPWRERIAAAFDPGWARPELRSLSGVTVRHESGSAVSALLFCGWLASRLGWEPGALVRQDSSLYGRARGGRQEVTVKLEPDRSLDVPGLSAVALEAASGAALALERGEGGLTARRRTRKGGESAYKLMGASRGEPGILGEGIRQALLRDPTYGPALEAACRMVG